MFFPISIGLIRIQALLNRHLVEELFSLVYPEKVACSATFGLEWDQSLAFEGLLPF